MTIIRKFRKDIKKKLRYYKLLNKLQKKETQIINVWKKKTNNIGDIVCSPSLYFKELQKNAISVDLTFFEKSSPIKNKTIIVGGGGLLLSTFKKYIDNILLLAKENTVIFWGVGFDNYVYEKDLISIDTKHLAKIAIRDFNQDKYEYVPCASCKSDLFEKYIDNQPKSRYGLYLHGGYSKLIRKDLSHLPYIDNLSVKSFQEVLEFLSSFEIILTNSFHGVYWATLLGKKVIVLPWVDEDNNQGFSNKFTSFKYKPYFLNNWNDYKNVKDLKSYPNALKECRDLNKKFLNSILEII